MAHEILVRILEHNNWANRRLIEACATLGNDILDATPEPGLPTTIRGLLRHVVEAQEDYYCQLVRGKRGFDGCDPSDFTELNRIAAISGEGLLDLVRNDRDNALGTSIHHDGYSIAPWLLFVQALNHANEHRMQIKRMMRYLGATPPRIDGWAYGSAVGALTKITP